MLISSLSPNAVPIEVKLTSESSRLVSEPAKECALGVALVGPPALFGEVLVSALEAAEPGARFTLHSSLNDWFASPGRTSDRVLILFLGNEELTISEKGNFAGLEKLKFLDPAPHFVICSSQEHYSQVLKALEVGAAGYVLSDMSLKVLVQVIHLVNAGGVFVPAASLKHLSASTQASMGNSVPSISGLSPRQVLVARALRRGTPNKVIAYELNMCESTVKVHVRHIMKKLHAKNRTQIAYLTNAMFSEGEAN